MKNEITTAVMIDEVTDKLLVEYMDAMGIANKLEEKEKLLFSKISKSFNLNPFKREIFCTVYGEGQYRQLSIITGYEVYIKRAERSGQLDGWSATTSGSLATGDLKATVTIYRKDRQHPFIWEAYYTECVQKTKAGVVTKFWEKANFMTKKVAISQGFRLCFSDELGGMPYTSDEMPSQEITENIQHEEVPTAIILTDKQIDKIKTKQDAEKYLQLLKDGKVAMTQVQELKLKNILKDE